MRRLEKHFIGILTFCFAGGILITLGGWEILRKMSGESQFPGIFTLEFLGGVFGLLLFFLFWALPACLIAWLFPSFRRNWKKWIHWPVWGGVLLGFLYMAVLVWMGYNAV
jgi:hypothetical protein